MAVEILQDMPDAQVHRGEPLASLRELVPQRRAGSFGGRLTGRAGFVLGTIAIHIVAIAGLAAASRVHTSLFDPAPMEVALIEEPDAPVERPPEYTMPPQNVSYVLPAPQDVTFEAETITPPPITTTAAISEPGSTVVTPPLVESVEYVRTPLPVFPRESARRREHGTVFLRVLVDPAGHAAQVRVERSSGFDRLDDAARDAVEKWLFRPHEVNGIAQAVQVIVPVEFKGRA